MSKINHLKRAVKILRENFSNEIEEDCNPYAYDENYLSNDWTWNLKHWTIQFCKDKDCESVVAYRAKNDLTDWSDYITLEVHKSTWKEAGKTIAFRGEL